MFPVPTLTTQGAWTHSPISPADLSPHEELLGDRGLLPAHLPESCAYPQDSTGEVPRPGAFGVQRVLMIKGIGDGHTQRGPPHRGLHTPYTLLCLETPPVT